MTCGLTCSGSFGNVDALWNKRYILGALVPCEAVVIVGFRPNHGASDQICSMLGLFCRSISATAEFEEVCPCKQALIVTSGER